MTTIIMVHGVGGTADAWSRLAPAFREQGWKVETPTLRPDKRTAENPPADLPKLRLKDYVDDIEALARDVEKAEGVAPVLFGHSMGGLIVQKVLERGAGRAGVLLTPAPPAGASAGGSAAQLFTFANVLFGGGPSKGHKIWKTGFSWGVLNLVPKAKHAGIYAGTVYDSGGVYADLGNPEKDESRTAFVDETRITAPILTIGGAKDRAVPIASVRLTGEKYKKIGGDYREYADNAHWIVDEPGTDKVIADIAEWLAANGVTAGPPAKAAPTAKPAAAKPKAAPKAKAEAKPKAPAKAPAPAPAAKAAPAPKATNAVKAPPKAKAAAPAKPAAKAAAKPLPVAKAAPPPKAVKAAAPAKAPVAKAAKPAAASKPAKAAPAAKAAPKAAAKPVAAKAPAKAGAAKAVKAPAKAAPKAAAKPAPAKTAAAPKAAAKPATPEGAAKPAAKVAAKAKTTAPKPKKA